MESGRVYADLVCFMNVFKLNDFKVLSTGVDGGHYYLSTHIEHEGIIREARVFFKYKSDEKILLNKLEILVQGNLIDQGYQQSLIISEAVILE